MSSLSDYIFEDGDIESYRVKQFIKDLKNEIGDMAHSPKGLDDYRICVVINKLAGDKLI